jgi:DNA-binding beta-propeller fold protein YncE
MKPVLVWATRAVASLVFVAQGHVAFAQEIFVPNGLNNSVTVYAQSANGNVAPLRTIAGAATGLDAPFGVAVDTVNNELFVANNGDGTE